MLFDNIFEGLCGPFTFHSYLQKDWNTLKTRRIYVPTPGMRQLQERLCTRLRSLERHIRDHTEEAHPPQTEEERCIALAQERVRRAFTSVIGGKRNASPYLHVSIHRQGRYVFKTDLARAYESISLGSLAAVLAWLDPETSESRALQFLETFCVSQERGLVTGGGASLDLFNLYAAVCVDGPILERMAPRGIRYSRYVDDLVLSAQRPFTKQERMFVRKIISQAGFRINDWKTVNADLALGPVEITGLQLAQRGRIYISRTYLTKLEGLIHRARTNTDRDLMPRIHGMVLWALRDSTRSHLRYRAPRAERRVQERYLALCEALGETPVPLPDYM